MSIVSTKPQKSILISRERLIVLVPASHPWAKGNSITLETLVTAPIVIGTASRWRGFRSLVNDMVAARGLKLDIAEEADDLPVLLQLVRSDLGCTILDASFISTLPPGIKPLEIADAHETLDISLAWRDDNLSPLAARFVDVAKAHASP
jgi:DNA-binding transcriptional LysR family regulator